MTAGDTAAVLALAKAAKMTDEGNSGEASNSSEKALCLDSVGGSYIEGRLLARLVHRFGITTRIKAGAECYSACALAFMAGRALGAEEDYPSRYMNVKAHLGFHAPYYDFRDGEQISGREVNELITESHKLIAEFIQFGSFASDYQYKPMFSVSLLVEMMGAGPREMALVDTVQDASRWGVALEGYPKQATVSEHAAVQACMNFLAWSVDKPADTVTDFSWVDLPLKTVERNIWGETHRMARIFTGGMEAQWCDVELPTAKAEGVLICSLDDFNGIRLRDCEDGSANWIPWYETLPPETPLASLSK
jgi:hypothetical protein